MWHKLETVCKGRCWFFWNCVVLGKAIRFSIWTTQEGGVRIDAVDPCGAVIMFGRRMGGV